MIDLEKLADSERELFDSRYKLLEPINEDGGTADVWLAVDIGPAGDEDLKTMTEEEWRERLEGGQRVAIKIYRPRNGRDVAGREMFREECKIVYDCAHSNLVPAKHYSIFMDLPYLVIPYFKNGSSEYLIGNLVNGKDIWKYVHDVASGLAYLHSLDPPIIHQDIKPANVLIGEDGHYAITDFGISTQPGGDDGETSGTMAYMSPEREKYKKPRKESDIWAFGATLYQLITGKLPYGRGGGKDQPDGEVKLDYPPIIPSNIKKLVNACLNKDPKQRPTAEELVLASVQKKENRWLGRAIIAVAVALIMSLAYWMTTPKTKKVKDRKIVLVKWNGEKDTVTYTGYLKDELPDGEGTAVYSNGDVYKGTFSLGKRDGGGVTWKMESMGDYDPCTFKNDSLIKGTFVFKTPQPGYEKFVGEFHPDGSPKRGRLVKANGKEDMVVFEGDFNESHPWNGTANQLMDNQGNVYKGEILEGNPCDGTIVDKNGAVHHIHKGKLKD